MPQIRDDCLTSVVTHPHNALGPQTHTWVPMGAQARIPPCSQEAITGYSHRATPHYPQVSIFASLHCALTLLLLFLFHFSNIYVLLLVVPGVSECLRSSQEWFQECDAPLVNYSTRQGSSQAWSAPTPPRSLQCPTDGHLRLACVWAPWLQTGGHLRLTCCPGPPPGAPCKGHLNPVHSRQGPRSQGRVVLVSNLLGALWTCASLDWSVSQNSLLTGTAWHWAGGLLGLVL
jgi:hypothetical protein